MLGKFTVRAQIFLNSAKIALFFFVLCCSDDTDFLFLFSFPCYADHERDWPPGK